MPITCKALKVRRLIRDDFDKAFAECDVVMGPTSPTAAFKIGEKADDPLAMYLSDIYTISCNLAGIAGVSIPCGFTEGGPADRPANPGGAVRGGEAAARRPDVRAGDRLAHAPAAMVGPFHLSRKQQFIFHLLVFPRRSPTRVCTAARPQQPCTRRGTRKRNNGMCRSHFFFAFVASRR